MSIRDKFKPTSTKELKAIVEDEDSKIATKRNTDTYTFKDGINKLRLFPKHEGEPSFYHILCQHWITIEKEDGEPGRRTVPNGKIHGGMAKDIIDEYIKFCRVQLADGDAESSAKLKALTSYEKGLQMQTSWMAYANAMQKDSKEFTLLEFKRTVRDALNDESIIEDEAEAIETDPFTDPDTGKPVLITYNSKAKKAADYYKVQVSKTAVPLTDEELEKFELVTPLSQLPMFQYDMEKYELALEGLRYFDEEQEIGVFDTDEFQAIVEEVREMVGGEAPAKKASPAAAKKTTAAAPAAKKPAPKKIVEEAEELEEAEEAEEEIEEIEEVVEDEADEFEAMDRAALKAYIKANGLDVKVFTTHDDDTIRNNIREALGATAVDEVEEEVEEEAPAPVTKKAPVAAAKAGAATPKKSLDQIKAELRAKAGK